MDPHDIVLVLGVALVALAALVFGPGLALKVFARGGEPPAFVGPLFRAEWQRLNRRGSQVWLRMGYVGLLLLGLFGVFVGEAPIDGSLPPDRVARLAERYFFLFCFLQFLALTVVTPVFVGGSIIEEQERCTIDLLLSSLLTRRELVTGKLAARVAFVLSLAAAGLPVLAFTLLFGGVDGTWLACAVVVTVFYTVGLAAFIFCFATRAKFAQSFSAVFAATLVMSYMTFMVGLLAVGMTRGLGFSGVAGVSPFAWLLLGVTRSESPVAAALVAVGFNGLFALVCGYLANPRSREVRSPRRVKKRLSRRRRYPRVDPAAPLVWKERYFTVQTYWETQPSPRRLVKVATIVGAGFVAASLLSFVLGGPMARILSAIFAAATAVLVVVVPAAGFLLAASVTRERQKQTLETLLSLPYGWDELLEAKWEVVDVFLQPFRIVYAVAAVAMVAGLVVHPLAAVVGAAVVFAELQLFLTLGLWLSVRCRSTVRAILWCVGAAAVAFLLPPLLGGPVGRVAAAYGWSGGAAGEVVSLLSPIVAVKLSRSGFRPDSPEEWLVDGAVGVVTALAYLATSVWLWRNACRTLGREDGS